MSIYVFFGDLSECVVYSSSFKEIQTHIYKEYIFYEHINILNSTLRLGFNTLRIELFMAYVLNLCISISYLWINTSICIITYKTRIQAVKSYYNWCEE